MNKSRSMMLVTIPIAMILALLVAIPLLLTDDCDPATSGATGPASDSISVMSWNLCANSCGSWDSRIGPALKHVGRHQPDILAVQEGGGSASTRDLTFKGFGAIGYTGANTHSPNTSRYIFYKPSKFTLVKAGSFSLGGSHGMSWAHLKTKVDGAEFVVVDTHLMYGSDSKSDRTRGRQMSAGLARIGTIAGGLPTIWPGDYNSNKTRKTDAPAVALKAAGMKDSINLAAQKTNTDTNSAKRRTATAPVVTNGNQLDHIYVSGGVTVSRWTQVVEAENGRYVAPFVTDHNSIIATVGVPGARPRTDSVGAVSGQVGKWKGEQIKNAAVIVSAGKAAGVNQRGQTIAVMTAMGESSLNAVNHGDAAGPDSRGLFQQRASWGSFAQRMDPQASATLFNRALLRVEGWADLEPTIAAHRVQRNADPNHYAKFWDDAVQVVASATGQNPAAADAAAAPGCTDDTTDAAWASGADCDFGTTVNPRTCTEALTEAARITRGSSCSNEVRGGSWRRRCLEFVARAYGYASSGTPTAKAQYRLLKSKGLVHTDQAPPAGALVFFTSSDPAGHVAISAGQGKAFSNDYVRPGCIDLTPMAQMGGGGQYLGWSPPVFPLGVPL